MVDKVTDQSILEPMSALMDNEASELELHRILKQSDSDLALKQTWSRYQAAAGAMRNETPAFDYTDLSSRISAAIEDEPTHQGQNTSIPEKKSGFLHSIGRFAIAASVAGAVVISVQTSNFDDASNQIAENGVESTVSPLSLPAGYKAPELRARTVSVDPTADARNQREARNILLVPYKANTPVTDKKIHQQLNRYISEHSEHAALNSGRGMMPFARVVPTADE